MSRTIMQEAGEAVNRSVAGVGHVILLSHVYVFVYYCLPIKARPAFR